MTGKITQFKNKSKNLLSRYAGIDSPRRARERAEAWRRHRERLSDDIERMIRSIGVLSWRWLKHEDGMSRDAERQEIEQLCADISEIAEERRYLKALIDNDRKAIEHYVWRSEGRYGHLFVDERVEHAEEVSRLARLDGDAPARSPEAEVAAPQRDLGGT